MSLDTFTESRVRSRCSWHTYERLLQENESSSSPRFTFDQGWLEMMSPSLEHERVNDAFRQLVGKIADHFGLDLFGTGSTTFRREDLQRGFEPDSSWYVHDASIVRALRQLDLTAHPAPELVLEIDISCSSLGKLDLYRALGVGEVWRWTEGSLVIHILEETGYRASPYSQIFPTVESKALSRLIHASSSSSRQDWNRLIAEWLTSLE